MERLPPHILFSTTRCVLALTIILVFFQISLAQNEKFSAPADQATNAGPNDASTDQDSASARQNAGASAGDSGSADNASAQSYGVNGQADDYSDVAAFEQAVIRTVSLTGESPGEVDFPQMSDFGLLNFPTSTMRSSQDSWQNQVFALVKIAVIIGAVIFWLRCLQVASDSEVQGSVEVDARGSLRGWNALLFTAGIFGLIASLVVPAAGAGALLLMAGVFLPYSMFVNWQRSHLVESAPQLGWLPSLKDRAIAKPVFEAIDGDASSGDDNTVTVRFVGKSALRETTGSVSQSVEDSPAFQYVLSTIGKAVADNATDLHINTRPKTVEIKQRIDGTLSSLAELPLSLGSSVINIFKILSELSIADKRRSQDGSFLADVGERRLSFRVSSQATQAGEKLSIRILDPSNTFTDLASLGMPDDVRVKCERQLAQKHGLILFVGATGAGKSTTACSAVQLIDTSIKNIVSIEDPIEYQIPNVDQVEVNLKAGQTFESALRSILRLDADVVFIGEIRDAETAKIAVQAAQTGQLVLATMHATDSVGGFQRLTDLVGDATAVASTVRAIVSQSLCRKLCPHCRIEYSADDELAGEVGIQPNASLYRSSAEMVLVCPVCEGRRVMSRRAVYEITEATPVIRELVRNKASLAEIREASIEAGMVPLREQASQLVKDGVISINEVNRVFGS